MLYFSAPGHRVLSGEQTKLDPDNNWGSAGFYCKNVKVFSFLPEDGIIIKNLGFLKTYQYYSYFFTKLINVEKLHICFRNSVFWHKELYSVGQIKYSFNEEKGAPFF